MASVTDFTQQQESVSVDTLACWGLSVKFSLRIHVESRCFIHKSIRAVKALDVKFALSQADNVLRTSQLHIPYASTYISAYESVITRPLFDCLPHVGDVC